MFKRTTAVDKILDLKGRVKIIQGGTSASKTFSILAILIDKAIKNPKIEVSVVSESIPHIRRGAYKDFIKILKSTNRYREAGLNKSLLTYTFGNGSIMEFFSADEPSKLRGARRDVLYINEANNISFESYNELAIRTKKEVYLDFNPTNEFWVHKELKDEEEASFIVLTYKDNEALDDSIIKEIEKAKEKAKTSNYWSNWWKVYGLGEVGSLDGVVFDNWKIINQIPNEARLIGCGLDFGYSNDPTAIIEVYKYNDKRILNEICYQKGLANNDIAKLINNRLPVYCDSAEPKSISELKRYGVNAYPVTKGSDSIRYGIDIMQGQEYLVTSNSLNLISELRKYTWSKDKKTGDKLNKPIDLFNHSIDAIRYHEMMVLGVLNRKAPTIR